MVACAGPLATRNCESRQVRKEATAAVDVCAGVGTVRVASNLTSLNYIRMPIYHLPGLKTQNVSRGRRS